MFLDLWPPLSHPVALLSSAARGGCSPTQSSRVPADTDCFAGSWSARSPAVCPGSLTRSALALDCPCREDLRARPGLDPEHPLLEEELPR